MLSYANEYAFDGLLEETGYCTARFGSERDVARPSDLRVSVPIPLVSSVRRPTA